MTYKELYEKADRKLEKGDVTWEEFDEMTKPLDEEIRPHGECKTCKHYVKGGLDGKTYVCEHPNIEQDDYYNYAFLAVEENDFCSSYEARKKEGGEK